MPYFESVPKYNSQGDNTEFLQMIDHHITTSVPDPATNQPLHDLVTLQVSTTTHYNSCLVLTIITICHSYKIPFTFRHTAPTTAEHAKKARGNAASTSPDLQHLHHS
jgi:hypothetical protein